MSNSILASLLLGLLASTSPCILPLYPGFLAYLSNQQETGRRTYFLGLFVLAGVLTMMITLGGVIAFLAIPIGRLLVYMIPLADLLILLLGILLLLNQNPFKALHPLQAPMLRHPYSNAFAYGLLYGPIALPCSGPLIVAIFALSLTVGETFRQLWIFLWFGLGLGLPLLILSFFSVAFQRQLIALLARNTRTVNFFGGLLLIGAAFYDLAKNWELLRLFLIS